MLLPLEVDPHATGTVHGKQCSVGSGSVNTAAPEYLMFVFRASVCLQLRQMDMRGAIVDTMEAVDAATTPQATPADAPAATPADIASQSPHESASHSTSGHQGDSLTNEAQSILSREAAALDDLVGEDNAASAEARFALALWGLFAGLPEADVKAQLRRHLLALGKAAPGGKDHLLVKRAQKAYERKFGQFEWPEEGLVTAQHMADADSDERGHVHGPGCGHTHQ